MSFFVVVPAVVTYYSAATVGAAVLGAIGVTAASTAVIGAVGAGVIAGGFTALRGGDAGDIFKSAVLGGVSSYVGGSVAGEVSSAVSDAAISSGSLSANAAATVGKVVGSAVSGGLTSGASALLSGKDPIEAFIRGGLTSAMSAGVGEAVNYAVKDVPGFGPPANATEAAFQRAAKAALATTIVSGGDISKIAPTVLNSFMMSAGMAVGKELKDLSSNVQSANDQFRESEREYTSNLEQQESLVAQYNDEIKPVQDLYANYEESKKDYDEAKAQLDAIRGGGAGNVYDYLVSQGGRPAQKGIGYVRMPDGQVIGTVAYSDTIISKYNSAVNELNAKVNEVNDKYTELLGGEVTKYRTEVVGTETQYQRVSGNDGEGSYSHMVPVEVPVETEVPYKETVVGTLTPLKDQLETLKSDLSELQSDVVAKKDNLTTAIQQFQDAETQNTELASKNLNDLITASKQYKDEFGVEPTEDQLRDFSSGGDILGAVSKVVADNNNEQFAKEAGFKNYADYTAAGNISPNEYYAKQQGWQDYAQQLNAQNNGYTEPAAWNTYINNQQTAVDNGFINYQDYQSAGDQTSNDFYAKKEGWTDYAQKQEAVNSGFNTPLTWTGHLNQEKAEARGFKNYADYVEAGGDRRGPFGSRYVQPATDFYAHKEGWQDYAQKQEAEKSGFNEPTSWAVHLDEVRKEDSAKAAGFPSYDIQQEYKNNLGEYQAKQEGWGSYFDKLNAAKYDITSPLKYEEFVSGKTEEQRAIEMLKERGLSTDPERVKSLTDAWNFDPSKPSIGFTEALNKSDNLKISNDKADTVQEAAALAQARGFSSFTFGGGQYTINTQSAGTNPYDFFASPDEAWKAARQDLGAGKNFEWTNPATGETKTYSTNSQKEQAVADQKRIDLMPAYTGEGMYTRTGNPGVVDNVFVDKKTGTVVEDNRVWDAMGNVISGELRSVKPGEDSAAGRVATSINEGIGKAAQAYIDVASGVVKGGANLLNQIGVIGGMTGLVNMDNWATRTAKEINEDIDKIRSTDFRNNQKLLNDAINKAGDAGFVAQAIEAAKQFGSSPLQTAEFIAQNGVSLLVGAGAMSVARALGAGMSVAEAAAIGANAVSQGASVAGEAYADAKRNGKSEEDALNAARVSWAGAALTSALANKYIPGALSNESAIAAQGIAKNSLSNALRGEMSSELAEEVSGKVIGNIAAGNAWDKDLGSTAVQALIGSGAVTGLVHVATTGNPQTAIAVMKDAGATDQQISNVTNALKASVGTGNSNVTQAKEQLTQLLSDSNLSPEVANQMGDLIATDAIKDAVSTSLASAGVPAAYVDVLADRTATQIYNNEGLPTVLGDVSAALQTSGMSALDANLIANQALTGTDVRQVVAEELRAQGYTPSADEVNALVSQNATAGLDAITTAVGSYVDPLSVSKEEARAALLSVGIQNPTEAQINLLAGQYNQSLLQSKATQAANTSTVATPAGTDTVTTPTVTTPTVTTPTVTTPTGTEAVTTPAVTTPAVTTPTVTTPTGTDTTVTTPAGTDTVTTPAVTTPAVTDTTATTPTVTTPTGTDTVTTPTATTPVVTTPTVTDTGAGTSTTTGAGTTTDATVTNPNTVVTDAGGSTNAGGSQAVVNQTGAGTDTVTNASVTAAINNAIASIQFPAGINKADVAAEIKAAMDANPGLKATDVSQAIAAYMQANPAVTSSEVSTAINNATNNLVTQTALNNALNTAAQETKTQFDTLTKSQQEIVSNAVTQGKTLTDAINDVQSSVTTQVTDLQKQIDTRINELLLQGKTLQEANDLAISEVGQQTQGVADELKKMKDAQKVAADQSQRQSLLNMGMGLIGGAGAGAIAEEPRKEITPLGGKGPAGKFSGPLEEFFKMVEQEDYTGTPQQQAGRNMPITSMQDRISNTAAPPENSYFSYGQPTDIDEFLSSYGQDTPLTRQTDNFTPGAKRGGLMSTPLMAKGGTHYGKNSQGALSIVNHAGKDRVDFRTGAAVSGKGDGQSDDIPAMLADGEFVFPADVVAAIGNGSTKAGSDKLYDMMHGIRAHVRSAKPQDLPPEIKSPLDFLKSRKARG